MFVFFFLFVSFRCVYQHVFDANTHDATTAHMKMAGAIREDEVNLLGVDSDAVVRTESGQM